MKFLRNLLAAILGCLIAFGIMFMMFFIFAALVGSSNDGVKIKSNSILELSFSEPISDYLGKNSDDPFGALFEEGQGLDEILHAIAIAKNDSKIKGISMNTSFLQAGFAQTQEIRRALEDFKAAGKFVYSYSDFYTQKDYYLASVADAMYLNPQGILDFKGLASEVLYYKSLQEKSGVKMEVIRHGKYKSAVEPFLSDTMSDENRSQIKELITSIWTSMLEDISETREIDIKSLNTIADTLGGRMPKYAVASGLIDGTFYFDEYESMLREQSGIDADAKLNYVSLEDYSTLANTKSIRSGTDKIAVIFAQGEILYGEGGKDYLGQGVINRALKKARDNDNIKAIVLRVDSPGGSALVSDIIWREIELTKEKKPVVVSFGNVAASGGYYIAAGADKIFAEPTTITGSIGVFGTVPNMTELADNIGINAEQVGTNANSVDYSLFEPMTDSFRNQILEGIENTYDTFLERVAAGRSMTVEDVNEIAQGRVWSGVDAKSLGLVDEIGNLDDAIEAAAKMVELENFGIRKYPKYKSDFERLMDDLGSAKASIGEAFVKEELGNELYQSLKEIKEMSKQRDIQARMPYTLNIK
ncbi:signal peptide peptidase SppA [Croceitalea vernalis]|uniref:Signal peptide peptidase SppA n=1 Tax=Croceitalea vernalis TaxID=3075599 RepID=A0ABU3BFX0_9FLAO|nr:signal peptide peptidase SppA [Croceitalea sp. P007]MDT0621066.1 signal peptide peptidase SppA [Croceitalea sp. P007]